MSDLGTAHRRLSASLAAARTAWGKRAIGSAPHKEGRTGEGNISAADGAALWCDHAFSEVVAGRPPSARPLRRAVVEMLMLGAGADELWMEVSQGSAFAKHAVRVAQI